MKFSKLLYWLGQIFAYVISRIAGAVDSITATVNGIGEKIVEVVSSSAAQTTSAVTTTVAESGAATIQAVNERSAEVKAETARNFEAMNSKLDNLAAEDEGTLRKALESTLPEELLKVFKFD